MLEIKKFVFNPFSENTYLIWDKDSLEAVVIDPGCSDSIEENELTELIANQNLAVKYLINTHCHLDHIFGNAFIKTKYNPIFIAPEKDLPLLKKAEEQADIFGVSINPSPLPDSFITEDLQISLGNVTPRFIFTPGHTPGEYSIYFGNENFCITGDVLFHESIGRTDLWGGDYNTLINSIMEKLFALPDDVVIYPGHNGLSTIGHERKYNPFLQ
ncbi:MAG: MBL fold metallo-hydrolase [Melioribacteraceae bacterium]|nr:MBL fold metallo-hydrolase [Melioribacteraceae bacterium]